MIHHGQTQDSDFWLRSSSKRWKAFNRHKALEQKGQTSSPREDGREDDRSVDLAGEKDVSTKSERTLKDIAHKCRILSANLENALENKEVAEMLEHMLFASEIPMLHKLLTRVSSVIDKNLKA